jgi:hypothetical protein
MLENMAVIVPCAGSDTLTRFNHEGLTGYRTYIDGINDASGSMFKPSMTVQMERVKSGSYTNNMKTNQFTKACANCWVAPKGDLLTI